MHEMRRRLLRNALRTADVAVMTVAFAIAFVVSGQHAEAGGLQEFFAARIQVVNFVWFAVFAAMWHLLFGWFGLGRARRSRLHASEWWAITKAVAVGTLLLSGLALLLDLAAVNRVFLGYFLVTALAGTVVTRAIVRLLLGEARRRGRNLRNLVIVGCGPRGADFGRQVRKRVELGYLLLGYIDDIRPPQNPLHGGPERLLGPPSRTREILRGLEVDEVVVRLPIRSYYEEISQIISVCEEMGILIHVPADFFASRLVHAYAEEPHGTPVLTLGDQTRSFGSGSMKRVIDVVGALLALIVLSPLLGLVAITVRLESRGPALFLQERAGLRNKMFTMVKFRTMRQGAEGKQKLLERQNEASGAAFKIEHDPRVTGVGRFLRKLSLDELPQFWNVLTGDMSLVGPRPLPRRDVERFDREWQRRRFSVKPGMTCLWQINGRHEVGFEHWMELDLQYIDSWSLSLDLDILAKTLPAVLRRTGAS